jgi:hypothetical protein
MHNMCCNKQEKLLSRASAAQIQRRMVEGGRQEADPPPLLPDLRARVR